MHKQIILGKGYGTYSDRATLVLADKEDLTIEVVNGENVDLYYVANNGTKEIKGKITGGKFEIPRDFIKIGELRLKIDGMVGENKVCGYSIENLLISEILGKIETMPQVENLLNKIEAYTDKINEFIDKVEKLMQLTKILCDIDTNMGE